MIREEDLYIRQQLALCFKYCSGNLGQHSVCLSTCLTSNQSPCLSSFRDLSFAAVEVNPYCTDSWPRITLPLVGQKWSHAKLMAFVNLLSIKLQARVRSGVRRFCQQLQLQHGTIWLNWDALRDSSKWWVINAAFHLLSSLTPFEVYCVRSKAYGCVHSFELTMRYWDAML